MRFKLITIIILILFSTCISAQLQVDAGNDTAFCFYNINDPVRIGGNPTAQGGVEPYSYIWSAKSPESAKYILNDTTASNPIIVNSSMGNITLRLTVKDKLGTEKSDSIMIRSVEIAQTLVYLNPTIDIGDTIVLPHNTFMYGIEPYSYFWTPDYNISDTNISNPMAWPDTSLRYQVYVVDSIGCKSGTDIVDVIVKHPLSTLTTFENITETMVIPNPIDGNSRIHIQIDKHKKLNIKVINTSGQIVISDIIYYDYYEIGDKIDKNGMYLYLIFDENQIISYGKFIRI